MGEHGGGSSCRSGIRPVSYTQMTLPTNRAVAVAGVCGTGKRGGGTGEEGRGGSERGRRDRGGYNDKERKERGGKGITGERREEGKKAREKEESAKEGHKENLNIVKMGICDNCDY